MAMQFAAPASKAVKVVPSQRGVVAPRFAVEKLQLYPSAFGYVKVPGSSTLSKRSHAPWQHANQDHVEGLERMLQEAKLEEEMHRQALEAHDAAMHRFNTGLALMQQQKVVAQRVIDGFGELLQLAEFAAQEHQALHFHEAVHMCGKAVVPVASEQEPHLFTHTPHSSRRAKALTHMTNCITQHLDDMSGSVSSLITTMGAPSSFAMHGSGRYNNVLPFPAAWTSEAPPADDSCAA